MCMHEGKPCPGQSCNCVCDNCVLGPGDEDDDDCPWCPFGGTPLCCSVDEAVAQGGQE